MTAGPAAVQQRARIKQAVEQCLSRGKKRVRESKTVCDYTDHVWQVTLVCCSSKGRDDMAGTCRRSYLTGSSWTDTICKACKWCPAAWLQLLHCLFKEYTSVAGGTETHHVSCTVRTINMMQGTSHACRAHETTIMTALFVRTSRRLPSLTSHPAYRPHLLL